MVLIFLIEYLKLKRTNKDHQIPAHRVKLLLYLRRAKNPVLKESLKRESLPEEQTEINSLTPEMVVPAKPYSFFEGLHVFRHIFWYVLVMNTILCDSVQMFKGFKGSWCP